MAHQESDVPFGKTSASVSSDFFVEMVRQFSEKLFNLAVRYTGSATEAEEIVQEVFLRAYQALPRLNLREPVEYWLFRVALNLCRDRNRKKNEWTFSDISPDGEWDQLVEDQISTEEQVEWGESKATLQKAVNGLSETERVIITLRYNEGLSYEQIAGIMEVPLATVGTHLFRAKKNLQRLLTSRTEDEP